jgi:membrane-associated phospholipid phosphatase
MNLNLLRLLTLALAFNVVGLNGLFSQPITEDDCWVCKDGKHVDEHPYKELTLKNELPFIITSVAALGGAFLTTSLNNTGASEAEVLALDRNDVSSFDRRATSYSSTSTASLSDYIRTGATFIPIFFLANHHTRDDVGALLVLTGEVMATTAGLTFMAKNIFPRYRPFLYNPEFTIEERISKTGTKSFFSGHTSHTAAFTFMMAKVYDDYHPNSKTFMKFAVWTLSAAIPAATGFFRVRAGKHFPTDVITGYAIGALSGWLIPHLHKKNLMKTEDYNVQLSLTPVGFGMRVRF